MISGAPWKRAKAAAGCSGYVRALEVTHGHGNGWHPHLHAIFLLDSEDGAAMFGEWLFDVWSRKVEKTGLGQCERSIWKFERAAHYDAAADYVVKGNFDMELTRGHMKVAKGGGRTPWQLLNDADRGDAHAVMLFREFANAFKGARQVTYSQGLRARYGLADEQTDEELATEDVGVVVGTIPARPFGRLVAKGLGSRALDAAETGGWSAVVALLQEEFVWSGEVDDEQPLALDVLSGAAQQDEARMSYI
jgi:hypothetical protein